MDTLFNPELRDPKQFLVVPGRLQSLSFKLGLATAKFPPDRVKVIDKSLWQKILEYKAMYAAGVRCIIAKATDGLATDPTFLQDVPRIRDAGMKLMVYHYMRRHLSGIDQAHHCLEVIQPALIAFENHVVVWEDLEDDDGVTNEVGRKNSFAFVDEVKRSFRKGGFYCSYNYWQSLMNNVDIGDNYGYLAQWTGLPEPTLIPIGWDPIAVDAAGNLEIPVWQNGIFDVYPWSFNPGGLMPGVHCDTDYFFGDEGTLSKFLGYEELPPTPVEERVNKLEAKVGSLEVSLANVLAIANQANNASRLNGDAIVQLQQQFATLTQSKLKVYGKMKERKPASYISGWNGATPSRPIFSIYPKETAPTSDRKFFEGRIQVLPVPIQGDGTRVFGYFVLSPNFTEVLEPLFVMWDDITLE